MVLDVIGTNRDAPFLKRAEEFVPDRFLEREPNAYDYVPHGGGDPATAFPVNPSPPRVLGASLQRLTGLQLQLAPEGHEVPLGRIPWLPPDRLRARGRAVAPLQSRRHCGASHHGRGEVDRDWDDDARLTVVNLTTLASTWLMVRGWVR